MAGLGNLPDKVMIEILSRLPPESLLRFKCVAKSWYALFNDPDFASSLKNLNVILTHSVKNNETDMYDAKFFLLDYPFQPTSPIKDRNLDCFFDRYSVFKISGHSHGLLCISLFPREIFLCNPFTRHVRELPPSTLSINAQQRFGDPFDDGVYSFPNAIGFRYDPKSKDFKVVRVVNYVVPPCFYHPPRAEVYHLKKDRWRELNTPIYGRADGYGGSSTFEMYHQGFYYWWADYIVDKLCPKGGRPRILWRFNMSDEVFDHISAPPEKDDGRFKAMGVLNGSIVLFYRTDPGDERSFEVWRMELNDGEEEESKSKGGVLWSKLFKIGPVLGAPTPLDFVSFDQVLMEDKEGQLLLYNIKTQHYKHLPFKGLVETFQATLFVKTLLSVNGGNK